MSKPRSYFRTFVLCTFVLCTFVLCTFALSNGNGNGKEDASSSKKNKKKRKTKKMEDSAMRDVVEQVQRILDNEQQDQHILVERSKFSVAQQVELQKILQERLGYAYKVLVAQSHLPNVDEFTDVARRHDDIFCQVRHDAALLRRAWSRRAPTTHLRRLLVDFEVRHKNRKRYRDELSQSDQDH